MENEKERRAFPKASTQSTGMASTNSCGGIPRQAIIGLTGSG